MFPLFISFILPRFYGNPKFVDFLDFVSMDCRVSNNNIHRIRIKKRDRSQYTHKWQNWKGGEKWCFV